ncbi:MAG TPA: glycosyltransferase family 2 protein, partial [Roseiarcus sp.]|nr:glycosyltransferase family 2 protein [Roseiarcus sp.]
MHSLVKPAPECEAGTKIQISVVVPVFNEEGNIPALVGQLMDVLKGLSSSFEIIAVNDGSHDRSLEELAVEARRSPALKVIDLRRNYGQTAAIMAGIDHASGEIIVMIDPDLQNDPAGIPALVAKLNEGHDVVSGWRKERKDAPIRRNLVSSIANRLISWISGVRLN